MATKPSKPTSVNPAPYSKFALAGEPPLQASSQSRWWPLERGRLGGGRLYSLSLDFRKQNRPTTPTRAGKRPFLTYKQDTVVAE